MKKKKEKYPSFADTLQDDMKAEYNKLQPVIMEIVKKGMTEGEKRSEKGEGIDKIQLDAAKIATSITQYYIEQLVGKPLSRAEISGKNGSPLALSVSFVLSDKKNSSDNPIEDDEDEDDDDIDEDNLDDEDAEDAEDDDNAIDDDGDDGSD